MAEPSEPNKRENQPARAESGGPSREDRAKESEAVEADPRVQAEGAYPSGSIRGGRAVGPIQGESERNGPIQVG